MALGVNHSNWAHPKKLHEQPLTEQSTKCNPRTPMPTGSKQAQRMPRYTSSRPTRSSQNPPSLTVKQMAEHHGELEILISLDILRADLSEGLKARIGKHHMSPNTTWSDQ
ncbi:hypothetical protein PSTG_01004 [Puccinia striiformis f. sp. tritici PST-78]|uniref:Uncharacterized protein n=1 Tax=Puccinia striiformis f. sp. tritici PST-78 TaxID=1165861 RepID=A0A0L0W3I1_9BASI|nr:hypothetical protein PSTG_01004 [Puccinia striiformis f. sp. tritici PST-78]